jgi:hypothetical protein
MRHSDPVGLSVRITTSTRWRGAGERSEIDMEKGNVGDFAPADPARHRAASALVTTNLIPSVYASSFV